MSAIPPGWLGSVIQTQGAQARAAGEKQASDDAGAERVGGGSFADKLQDVIDETERDSQVYSDAEGTGSQGRPFESAEREVGGEGGDENEAAPNLDVQA